MYSFFYQIILDQGLIPEPLELAFDGNFWQAMTLVLAGVIIWMIKRDNAKRDRREEKNMEVISSLQTQVAALSAQVEGMRLDIERLFSKKK